MQLVAQPVALGFQFGNLLGHRRPDLRSPAAGGLFGGLANKVTLGEGPWSITNLDDRLALRSHVELAVEVDLDPFALCGQVGLGPAAFRVEMAVEFVAQPIAFGGDLLVECSPESLAFGGDLPIEPGPSLGPVGGEALLPGIEFE